MMVPAPCELLKSIPQGRNDNQKLFKVPSETGMREYSLYQIFRRIGLLIFPALAVTNYLHYAFKRTAAFCQAISNVTLAVVFQRSKVFTIRAPKMRSLE